MLSAMAHVAHPDWLKVADVLLSALRTVEPDRADLYTDVVFAALPVAARRTMEAMMTARALMSTRTYEYQSEFARRYFLQGRAEGERVALLTILDARGIDVPDQARARILGCTDLEQFDVWIRRAATARAIDDLFA